MGAYSPVPFVGDEVVDTVMTTAILPTLREMSARDAEYRGALYCGLMLTAEGPKVIEYNVRFGDPESQVLVPRFRSDLYAHLHESATGKLLTRPEFDEGACVGVAMAAEGYPPAPLRKGDVIAGLDAAAAHDGVAVFHAATASDADGNVVTNGGRVLTVSAVGSDVRSARDRAYAAAAKISWPGVHYRRDIAAQALT
jgi:phosphoribosylamine--glycine ligase